jgi:hypothetical protein
MQTESARMSSAAEARFRIDYPNSEPRVVKVVALDHASERVVKQVARQRWQRADFFTSLRLDGTAPSQAWSMQVASADLVVMVASAGDAAEAASVIGEACAARKVMTTAFWRLPFAVVGGIPLASRTVRRQDNSRRSLPVTGRQVPDLRMQRTVVVVEPR